MASTACGLYVGLAVNGVLYGIQGAKVVADGGAGTTPRDVAVRLYRDADPTNLW